MTRNRHLDGHWPINANRFVPFVWLAFFLFASYFAVRGIPHYLHLLRSPCDGPACFPAQLTSEVAAVWIASGSNLEIYALVRMLILLTIGGLLIGTAALLIWRKRHRRLPVLTAFVATALATSTLSQALAHAQPGFYVPAQLIHLVQIGGVLPLLFLFPDDRFHPRWMRWVAVLYVVVSLLYVFQSDRVVGASGSTAGLRWFVILVLFWVTGVAVLVYRFRRAVTAIEQEQMLWVLAGIGLATGAVLLGTPVELMSTARVSTGTFPPDPLLIALVDMLLVVGSGTCLLVALLNYEPINSEFLVNRALVYSVLSACIVGIYMALVGGLGTLFQSRGNILFSLLATGFIAVLVQPLRERLQRTVNRLMYGERDEPYQLLARLGQRLETALGPSAALPLAAETIAHALKLPYVAIQHRQNETLQIVAAYGATQNSLTTYPLVFAGQTIGELSVASRTANQPLTPADHRLLHDLARQISVSVHAVLLLADLEQARQRAVAAREEARRRLGSDLHDGVGHQLTGLARQVEAAVSLLDQDVPAARRQLTAVTQQLIAAVSHVRQLAHQLHPPELELLGLVGALRERALTHPGLQIHVEAPEVLPPVPPAVETAAYYIALEALTNVEKYAARSSWLYLTLVDGSLTLNITDDGPGLPPERVDGLGLLSMKARAAEVGGTCHIESGPTGGTRVLVRLPCSDENSSAPALE